MSFDWYPWYVQHFRRKTMHLTLAQDGAYRRLIDEYMTMQGALPADDQSLARICGCSIDEWLAVSEMVRAFFHPQNGKLIHKRCEKELHAQRMLQASRSAKARDAANAMWEKRRSLKRLDANALLVQSVSNAQAMLSDATRQSKYKNGTSSPVDSSGQPTKKPSEATRADLETIFAAKRHTA